MKSFILSLLIFYSTANPTGLRYGIDAMLSLLGCLSLYRGIKFHEIYRCRAWYKDNQGNSHYSYERFLERRQRFFAYEEYKATFSNNFMGVASLINISKNYPSLSGLIECSNITGYLWMAIAGLCSLRIYKYKSLLSKYNRIKRRNTVFKNHRS